MAIINTITYSELENRTRIEAEFYKPAYMQIEHTIKKTNYIKLKGLCSKITDGTHYTPKYVNTGIRFYSALNVRENFFLHEDKYKYITPHEHQFLYKRCNPQTGDILMRKVGVGPRWSCVIPDGLPQFSIFVSVALLKLKSNSINPYYLSTFINSHFGQSQLLRIQKGVSQPDLHLEDIAELKVPMLNKEQQDYIGNITIEAINKLEDSKRLHNKANNIFTDFLGFANDFTLKNNINILPFSQIVNTHRIDAQCFKHEYLYIENWIRENCSHDKLGNLLNMTIKGNQKEVLDSGKYPYVSIKDIDNFEIIPNGFCDSFTLPAEKEDLLFAITGATIGKVGLVYRLEQLGYSGDLLNLKINKSKISPYYLITALKSELCQKQVNRWITGATNGHLSPSDIKKILIPRLTFEKEEEISSLIIQSIENKIEAEHLFKDALLEAERLIEKYANN
jgi:restriction endonuclease S subunit